MEAKERSTQRREMGSARDSQKRPRSAVMLQEENARSVGSCNSMDRTGHGVHACGWAHAGGLPRAA